MKKFYYEPEMAINVFEAEDIMTASNSNTNSGSGIDDLSSGYATANGTLSVSNGEVILEFK